MHTNTLTFDPADYFATGSDSVVQPVPAHAVGNFKLATHRALTLTLKSAGMLRIAHGQAWLTFAEAANDTSARAGDHFLSSGQTIFLKGAQVVVIEALNADLYFDVASCVPSQAAFDSPAHTSSPVTGGFLAAASNRFMTLVIWPWPRGLQRRSQLVRACGQIYLHPFAAAAPGCQS